MDCTHAEMLVSAALDGEQRAADETVLRNHLAVCGPCRTFASDAEALHRVVRIAPAEPVPDRTAAILAATAPVSTWEHAADGLTLRLILVAVATVQILASVPALFGGSAHGQHLSAVDLALAVGFLWVAARGSRTLSGFLPLGTALVVLCLGLTLSDTLSGNGESVQLVTHSIAGLGIIVAWLLEIQLHRGPGDRSRGQVPAPT